MSAGPDQSTSPRATARDATARQDKLQRLRLRMTLLSLANNALQAMIIGLFAWAGDVAWSVVGLFLLANASTTALFALAIRSGINLRLRDPGMLMAQVACNVALQLAFLVLAPQLWVLFLVAVLVTYNFSMLAFTARQFTMAWLLIGAASALAMFAARGRFGHPATTGASIAILWLFFFLCIRQLRAVGSQFSVLRAQLSERNQQLSESLARIEQLASHDHLTGALNRRRFMELLAEESARAQRNQQPFCVALFDIDHFKEVNDRFGHAVGDAVLREFCALVSSGMRVTDRFARYGGEEFILLLAPATTTDEAQIATERIRRAVESHDWTRIAPGLRLTASAGLTLFSPGEGAEVSILRADRALYSAKNGGRNSTVLG